MRRIIRSPNDIARETIENAGRRRFFGKAASLGVGGLTGSAALLASINDGAKAQGDPIKVGGAVPITGWAAADGIEFQRGLEGRSSQCSRTPRNRAQTT
jgi:hypothetical protein